MMSLEQACNSLIHVLNHTLSDNQEIRKNNQHDYLKLIEKLSDLSNSRSEDLSIECANEIVILLRDSGNPIYYGFSRIFDLLDRIVDERSESPEFKKATGEIGLRPKPFNKANKIYENFSEIKRILKGHSMTGDYESAVAEGILCIILGWELLNVGVGKTLGIVHPYEKEKRNRQEGNPKIGEETWKKLEEFNQIYKDIYYNSKPMEEMGFHTPLSLRELRNECVHGDAEFKPKLVIARGHYLSILTLISYVIFIEKIWLSLITQLSWATLTQPEYW